MAQAEDPFTQWCQDGGFGDYCDKIKDHAETLDDLSMADDNDINEIVKELQMPMKIKLKFKKAVAALKQNKSNAVATKNESKIVEPGSNGNNEDSSFTLDAGNNIGKIELKDDEKELEGFVIKPDMPINSGVYVVPTVSKEFINGNWKTIMVIGETGSGKSTTLNSMVNYLWNVDLTDHYRWVLIPPPDDDSKQAESVTTQVTSYHIQPPRLQYGLTIVDTPGFGDTHGMKTDAEIVDKIEKAFKEDLDTIDAVFFVLKSAQARLTTMQRYVFNSMLRVFGRDIKDNLFLLITFCDGADPPVYASVKKYELPYQQSFELNNSAFFTGFQEYFDKNEKTGKTNVKKLDLQKDRLKLLSNEKLTDWIKNKPKEKVQRKTTANFWEMGIDAMENLFRVLGETTPKSLSLCREVLDLRKQLQLRIESLHTRITKGLNLIASIRSIIDTIKTHAKDVNSSKNFRITVPDTRLKKVDTDNNVTTCSNCKYTCHRNCGYSNNADKKDCCAMDSSGNCTVCPKKCFWNCHTNEKYYLVNESFTRTETLTSLKAKFDKSTEGMTNSERIIISQTDLIMQEQAKVSQDIIEVRLCIETLSEIALKPLVMEEDEYYQLMIDSEQDQKEVGYKERIKTLKQLREQAKQVRLLQETDKGDEFETAKLFQSQLEQLEKDLQELKKIQGDAPQAASAVLERVSNKIQATQATFVKSSNEQRQKYAKEKKTILQKCIDAAKTFVPGV